MTHSTNSSESTPGDWLVKQAIQQTCQFLQLAEMHYARKIPFGGVRFDLSGRAAGLAVFPARAAPHIRYNRLLLEQNGQVFLQQTPPHEVAHLVAFNLHGRSIRPHGSEWREIMNFFGADSSRCHQFDLGNNPVKRLQHFSYACGCRQHLLTSIRHNRVLKGQQYRCTRCGQALRVAS